jgi:CMP-N,N'-diacetyllegionaminic acid synthase
MRILGLIPARGGSKGVPKKNVKQLCGKPLISYTIEEALNSKLLTDILVSSDDDTILAIANSNKFIIGLKRPSPLATDESPTFLTVIHALEFLEEQGMEYDAVCLLQPTNPFRKHNFIDAAILKFKESNTDSLVSVLEVPHVYNPHWVFEKNKKGNLVISTGEKNIITRRQDLPASFYRDGSIYITKTDVLLSKKSLYGDSISYIESDASAHINIDTIDDWNRAEELLNKKNTK